MGAPPPESADKPEAIIPLRITLASPKDVPLLYAHQLIVNFTGNEFYVTVYRIAPEPWSAGASPSPEVEGLPLARFAFSALGWLANVESLSDQIRKLHAEGNITDEQLAAAKKAIGQ